MPEKYKYETLLEQRKDRQRAGIEQAKKRAVYTGRRKGSLVSSPRAREASVAGLRVSEIASALRVSEATVVPLFPRSIDLCSSIHGSH